MSQEKCRSPVPAGHKLCHTYVTPGLCQLQHMCQHPHTTTDGIHRHQDTLCPSSATRHAATIKCCVAAVSGSGAGKNTPNSTPRTAPQHTCSQHGRQAASAVMCYVSNRRTLSYVSSGQPWWPFLDHTDVVPIVHPAWLQVGVQHGTPRLTCIACTVELP